jgi:hypothetical protein
VTVPPLLKMFSPDAPALRIVLESSASPPLSMPPAEGAELPLTTQFLTIVSP